jgi:hypothetical protein
MPAIDSRRSGLFALAIAFLGTDAAQADWLDDVWSEDSVRTNGNPAASISDDTVYVVLPVASLHQAYEQGLTTEEALHDFLNRHGQRCSSLIYLNVPHPNLKVMLSLQARTSFEGVWEEDKVLTRLTTAYVKYHADDSYPLLFTISPVKFEYSINYVPTRQVRCVAPKDDDSTS